MAVNPVNNMVQQHHMAIKWQSLINPQTQPVLTANIRDKTLVVGRIGLMMLASGAGAYRVRESMNDIAMHLELNCASDIGLTTINLTCFNQSESETQVLDIANTGVNTDQLNQLEEMVRYFKIHIQTLTVKDVHHQLDEISTCKGNYQPWQLGFAAGLACMGFIFLLGGGWPEMICAFIGAGFGNFTRATCGKKHLTTLLGLALAVAMAGFMYFVSFKGLQMTFDISALHEAGYIGAMLFVIPGFPLITSFLDLSKLDIRSGIERLVYAIMITTTAAVVGWALAIILHIQPANFINQQLTPIVLLLLRLGASFCGVFGFSIMFNSRIKMAMTAAVIGALVAGLLASVINHWQAYPSIALTVPSIVIMVPGLYIYRGVYSIGINQLANGANWLSKAILIILGIAFGLFFARVLMDRNWRHVG